MYNDVGRTYLFDLDGWQIANPPPIEKLREVDPRLAELAERVKGKAERKWAEENDGDNEGEAGEEDGQGEDGSYNAYCGASGRLPRECRCAAVIRMLADLPVDAFHFGVSNQAIWNR